MISLIGSINLFSLSASASDVKTSCISMNKKTKKNTDILNLFGKSGTRKNNQDQNNIQNNILSRIRKSNIKKIDIKNNFNTNEKKNNIFEKGEDQYSKTCMLKNNINTNDILSRIRKSNIKKIDIKNNFNTSEKKNNIFEKGENQYSKTCMLKNNINTNDILSRIGKRNIKHSGIKINNFVNEKNIMQNLSYSNYTTKKSDKLDEGGISSNNSFAMQKNEEMNTVGSVDSEGFKYIDNITFEDMKNIRVLEKDRWLYFDLDDVRQYYRYVRTGMPFYYIPELKEVIEKYPALEKYKFPDVKGKTVVDPQYIVQKGFGRTNYFYDDSLKYFKKDDEEIYQNTRGFKFKKLPVANDFENRYEVIEHDGKIYYKGYDGVVYEVVPKIVTKKGKTKTRLSYQIDGKEIFYSIQGEERYFWSPEHRRENYYKPLEEQLKYFKIYYDEEMKQRSYEKNR